MSIDLDKINSDMTAFANTVEFTISDDILRPKLPRAVAKAVIDNHADLVNEIRALRAEVLEINERFGQCDTERCELKTALANAWVDNERLTAEFAMLKQSIEDVKKASTFSKTGPATEG